MNWVQELAEGIRHSHDDVARPVFLEKVWHRRQELAGWLGQDAYFRQRFQTESLPTFLHGGSPAGRIVVMGINPGWNEADNAGFDDPYKAASASNYVGMHEHFFEVFPRQIREGHRKPSKWWSKLATVLAGVLGDPAPSRTSRWDYLADRCVAQDVIPFHSARDLVRPDEMNSNSFLREISAATLDSLSATRARLVVAFSRQGYDLLRPALRFEDETLLQGSRDRTIRAAVGLIGGTPCLLVQNQVLVQPRFPYDELLPQLRDLARQALTAQAPRIEPQP